eukprot:268854_1
MIYFNFFSAESRHMATGAYAASTQPKFWPFEYIHTPIYINPERSQRTPTLIKIQEIELQKLLSEKLLKHWSTSDVILWLKLVNDGLFAKYTHIFESKQIDGKALMNMDDNTVATQLLGTQHHSLVFVQSIKQLKTKNGRKMTTHRRRLSRRLKTQSLASLPFDKAHIFDAPPTLTHTRSFTPTGFKSRPSRPISNTTFQYPSSPPISKSSQTPRNHSSAHRTRSPHMHYNKRRRSHSHDAAGFVEQKEPTDKKALWRMYRDKDVYSAILFKRGWFNTSFKKRWLVLCERKKGGWSGTRPMSNSSACRTRSRVFRHNTKANVVRKGVNVERAKSNERYAAHLFYFNERPVKDSDYPNGFVDLSSVECVVGLLDDEEDEAEENSNNGKENIKGDNHKHVKYLRNKGKSEYYEIVLKTKEREWVFGAIDTSSYVEWLIRLKKYEN